VCSSDLENILTPKEPIKQMTEKEEREYKQGKKVEVDAIEEGKK
jgi:hypothetical protein